jgi:hypothetical protein
MKKINNVINVIAAGLFFLFATTASAQEFASEKKGEVMQSAIKSRHKVAIMPIIYIGDDNDDRSEEMRFVLQDIAVSYMSGSAAELKFMDAAEINAILYKNGIDEETIREYTPKELAELLHVEYVIMGSVLQDKGSIVTTTNQHSTRREVVEHHGRYDRYEWYDRHGRHESGRAVVNRNHNTRSTVTRQNIETHVSITIYNEEGERIYSKSRQSILSETDAYKNALHYLLKRTPLYNR